MAHIVVIGAGQAGAACVSKLRALGCADNITLIGAEPYLPYQRPPLSKAYMLGEFLRERLFLRPEEFYRENDIELLLDTRVDGVDVHAKRIYMEEKTLSYDQLVLAIGADARRLPNAIGGGLEGVFTLRTIADADQIKHCFSPDKRCLIVGGGYIGLEAAAIGIKSGVKVTLIESSERILQRVAAREVSDYFRALHRGNGVTILENTGLEQLLGDKAVHGARLSDGQVLDVDFVLVGIGVEARVDFLAESGLAGTGGIAVDQFGQTKNPFIWAAGDCAIFPYRGMDTRLESVQNAIDQGEAVARNIMGEQQPYFPMPWFWSDQYSTKLQIAGLNRGYDRVVARIGGAEGGQSFWYYQGDQLLAVDALNAPRAYMIAKRLLEAERVVDADKVADPAQDLKVLLSS